MNTERADHAGSQPWWPLGLNLAERLAGAPTAPGHRPGAHGRLNDWRTIFDQYDPTGFDRRLAQLPLTESGLLTLLAEPPESLARRAGMPEWARFVDTALAAGSTDAAMPAGGDAGDWEDDFAAVLAPFVRQVRQDIRRSAGADDTDVECIVASTAQLLDRHLVRLVARTFVLELNLKRVTGGLAGRTPRDRFATFVRWLSNRTNLRGVLDEYPVLGRIIGTACRNAADAGAELLRRFRADRDHIVEELFGGDDPGALVAADQAIGDLHARGRGVTILRFARGGTIVYKPRPLDMHQHFNDVVRWLDGVLPGFDLRTVRIVRGVGYGWLEYVAPRPCDAVCEVDRFYRRLGALLALLYALDGVDVHYENLIAAGDQPVLVDVETLLHPVLPRPVTAGQDPAADVVARSALRVGLLPMPVVGDLGAADMSGAGGEGTRDDVYPAEGVAWDRPTTDTMRLTRRAIRFVPAHNRPRLRGEDVIPADHQTALAQGFRTAYDAIAAHRSALLGDDGLLARFRSDEMRVIARPTRLYANLLDESTHPDVLRDALDRDRLFDLVWVDSLPDPLRSRLVRHEIEDLWAGDVPTFSGRPDSRDLRSSSGVPVSDALAEPGLLATEAKIRGMGPRDRERQEWLVTASFAARGKEAEHRSGRRPAPSRRTESATTSEALLAAAWSIGDELVASAVHGHGRANWVGMEVVEDRHWVIMPAGAGLADGYSGIALFLAQLAHFTGDARHRDLARLAVAPVGDLVNALAAAPDTAADVGVGGYHGLGGIAYALLRLSVLLDAADLGAAAARTIDLMAAMDDGTDHSVALGRAGGLAAALAVWERTGLPAAFNLAHRYADSLLTDCRPLATGADGDGHTGFARGPAGVGWALSRFTAAFGGEHYRAAGRAAILRDLGASNTDEAGWCNGTAGMAAASAATHDRRTAKDLDLLTRAIAHRKPAIDMSLCHGELGALEALDMLAALHAEAAVELDRRTVLFATALTDTGPVCGTPAAVPTPGLMSGMAGIGYGALRFAFPDQVPSVLRLEPEKRVTATI